MLPRRALPLVALLALATPAFGAAPGPAPSGGPAPFTTLACPLLNDLERCNVRATARTGPANEIDVAMDPRDPSHLVAVAKAYNYTRHAGSALLGGVITAYATSFDGGRTWHEGYLQPFAPLASLNGLEPGRSRFRESDPVVEVAPDGAVLAVTLRFGGGSGLPVYRSGDGGVTFQEVGNAFEASTDKEWFVVDPATGNVYLATLGADGRGTDFARSVDGGKTWSAPKRICRCVWPAIDVGPGGAIYVAGYTGHEILFTRSLDQGGTWSEPRPIAPHEGSAFVPCGARLFRTPSIPQMASSRASGLVAVVWSDRPPGTPLLPLDCPQVPNHDVWLVRSTDGGDTWSAPIRVSDDPGPGFQFMPAVAVSPNGRDLHVAWLDQRNDLGGLTAEAFYAHSPDGGATWEPNLRVSDAPFLVALSHHQSASQGPFLGDYMGLAASDERAVVAFPDTRYGRADAFVATIV